MRKHLVFLFLLLLFVPLNVFSLVDKDDNSFVVDQADILTDETIEYIDGNSHYLNESLAIDYYVVVVENLNNFTVEEYADKIYDKFDISEKGLLILVSTDDRRMRVKVGEELSDIVYPQIIDEYIEQFFMTSFKNGEWDEVMKNGYSSFYKLLCNYYDVDSSEIEVYKDGFISKNKNYIIFLIIWFITIIGYIFSEYFFRLFLKKNSSNVNMDTLIFGVCLFVSMLLLNLTYLIMPRAIIIVLAFELIAIFSNMLNNSNDKVKKKRKRKVVRSKKKKRKITK